LMMLRLESDGQIKVAIIPGHAGEPKIELVSAFESSEIGLRESHGRFASAVGSEVEEDHAIMVTDSSNSFAGGIDDCDWFHEFIGYALGIILLYSCDRVGSRPALSKDEEAICFFDAVPALVAVHCEITADHGCDLPDTVFGGLLDEVSYIAGA